MERPIPQQAYYDRYHTVYRNSFSIRPTAIHSRLVRTSYCTALLSRFWIQRFGWMQSFHIFRRKEDLLKLYIPAGSNPTAQYLGAKKQTNSNISNPSDEQEHYATNKSLICIMKFAMKFVTSIFLLALCVVEAQQHERHSGKTYDMNEECDADGWVDA